MNQIRGLLGHRLHYSASIHIPSCLGSTNAALFDAIQTTYPARLVDITSLPARSPSPNLQLAYQCLPLPTSIFHSSSKHSAVPITHRPNPPSASPGNPRTARTLFPDATILTDKQTTTYSLFTTGPSNSPVAQITAAATHHHLSNADSGNRTCFPTYYIP